MVSAKRKRGEKRESESESAQRVMEMMQMRMTRGESERETGEGKAGEPQRLDDGERKREEGEGRPALVARESKRVRQQSGGRECEWERQHSWKGRVKSNAHTHSLTHSRIHERRDASIWKGKERASGERGADGKRAAERASNGGDDDDEEEDGQESTRELRNATRSTRRPVLYRLFKVCARVKQSVLLPHAAAEAVCSLGNGVHLSFSLPLPVLPLQRV